MKIAFDLRSLQSGSVSGVENYTLNLLERLLALDKKNTYKLFYNSFKTLNLGDFQYINVTVMKSSIPNKILNLGLKFNIFQAEKFTQGFDLLFMPNLNAINLNTQSKIALTVHDLSFVVSPEFYDLKRSLWHKFLNVKKLLNRADLIFAVSNHTKQELLNYYRLQEDKITVIYPGVDSQIFRPDILFEKLRFVRNHYDLPGDYFLFLNTIEPRKNLEGVLEAFEAINLKTHLVIAGKKGWRTSKDLKLLKRSPKKQKIHYIGYVDEEHKPALIKMATALLYPSFYEGFGFQVLEAMACGTPVIASQVTSLPEVAGDCALLVNPKNLRDLTVSMHNLEKNEPLKRILKAKALERVKNFNWDKTAKLTLTALENLCA